jgi:hypothetical protein
MTKEGESMKVKDEDQDDPRDRKDDSSEKDDPRKDAEPRDIETDYRGPRPRQ